MERLVISSQYIPKPSKDHKSAMKKMPRPTPSLRQGYNISRYTECNELTDPKKKYLKSLLIMITEHM